MAHPVTNYNHKGTCTTTLIDWIYIQSFIFLETFALLYIMDGFRDAENGYIRQNSLITIFPYFISKKAKVLTIQKLKVKRDWREVFFV